MNHRTSRQVVKRVLLALVFVVSFGLNVYLFATHHHAVAATKKAELVIDSDQKIKDIEAYLDSISPSYVSDVQFLAKERGLTSWGCGPSSYSLAKILNKKFFNNELTVGATYNSENPYQIVQRFSLARKGTQLGDHSWIEIYFKDKFLFIDPTIGQFGRYNKIMYEVFNVGQSNTLSILKSKYNIEDIRITRLISKVINRVPAEQEPYPGLTIQQSSIDYYLQVLDDHNSVNNGIEPAEWTDWVQFLTSKYQQQQQQQQVSIF